MTEKEIMLLEQQKAFAKRKCGECWEMIQQLEKWLKIYKNTHTKFEQKYKEADRKLAEETKYQVLPPKKNKQKKEAEITDDDLKLIVKLDKVQLRSLADKLGIKLEK